MEKHRLFGRRRRCAALACVCFGMVVVGSRPATGSEDATSIIRIEEEWKLVLKAPDSNVVAPQFHTAFAPSSGYLSAQVSWNYWELQQFKPGGMQLQIWYGDSPLAKTGYRDDELSTNAETITWSQVMAINGSEFTFAIENGNSQTWGDFGGPSLTITGHVNLWNLNDYDPDFSFDNSGITYGTNRIESLEIVSVKYYDEDGLYYTDSASRTVYPAE